MGFRFRAEGGNLFPFGKSERKEERESAADMAAHAQESEKRDVERGRPPYIVYDSPLQGPDSDDSFDLTFEYVLPPGSGTLRHYIQETLEKKRGEAIGIEFGGPGSALFSGFPRGFFERTLGVTLADVRGVLSPDQIAKDEERHHTVLEANLLAAGTYEKVKQWLAGRKVDLIIERLAGGREYMPEEPYLLAETFEQWYELSSEGGLILAQTSSWMRPLILPWVEHLNEIHHEVLDIGYVSDPSGKDVRDALRLHKLAGAPEKLPMLDPRTVREISKKNAGREV
jgi:hypothetical protein